MKDDIARLFVSKSSFYFDDEVNKLMQIVDALSRKAPLTPLVIDVNEQPEEAEKFRIDALPTLIIGTTRFVGQLETEKIVQYLAAK